MPLISPELLESLGATYCREGILTIYVGVDPVLSYSPQHSLIAVKSALRRIERRLGEDARSNAFETEKERALAFLEREWTPEAGNLVLISSAPVGLWETIHVDVRVPSSAFFGPTPHLRLLAEILDEYERYCVAAVDKQDATLLLVQMGAVEEEENFRDFTPGKHDQGGWSQARFQRHHEFHVSSHLKRIVARLEQYLQVRPFERLLIVGPEEVTAQLTRLLPKPLDERLIGVVASEAKPGSKSIMAAVAPVIERFEREAEEAFISQIAEEADAGGRAVLGLQATLDKLTEGRVRQLAAADGLACSGRECLSCGHLDTGRSRSCPRCSAEMDEVPDVVERAIEQAYAHEGRVEIVFGTARERLVARGGLGGLLRY